MQAGQQPGTVEDIDFYYAPSMSKPGYEDAYEAHPPDRGWQPLPKHGLAPPPTVYVMHSDDEVDEESDDDQITHHPPHAGGSSGEEDDVGVDGSPGY